MPNKFECIVEPNQGKTYYISIWDSIEEYEDYDKLFEQLSKITKSDTVELSISSPGGRCDIGYTIFDRIHSLECKVDVVIPYPAYSMGAILALSGDSLEINPGAYLMFHDYSTGHSRSKGTEIFKYSEAYSEAFKYRFNEICQPFLTEKECEDILNGKDLYVKWNSKELKDRIKRHFGGRT